MKMRGGETQPVVDGPLVYLGGSGRLPHQAVQEVREQLDSDKEENKPSLTLEVLKMDAVDHLVCRLTGGTAGGRGVSIEVAHSRHHFLLLCDGAGAGEAVVSVGKALILHSLINKQSVLEQ